MPIFIDRLLELTCQISNPGATDRFEELLCTILLKRISIPDMTRLGRDGSATDENGQPTFCHTSERHQCSHW